MEWFLSKSTRDNYLRVQGVFVQLIFLLGGPHCLFNTLLFWTSSSRLAGCSLPHHQERCPQPAPCTLPPAHSERLEKKASPSSHWGAGCKGLKRQTRHKHLRLKRLHVTFNCSLQSITTSRWQRWSAFAGKMLKKPKCIVNTNNI